MFHLLNTQNYSDFTIMTYLLKNYRIDVNSGQQLPINRAIIHGNILLIKTLIEVGKVNFSVLSRDPATSGKAPIHIAAQACNMDVVKIIYEKGGNLNLPDEKGYTAMHYLCEGSVSREEYEFIKAMVETFPDM